MKEKRVIFTIVAKNYMASALTLKESVLKLYSDVDFYIVLADQWNDEEQKKRAGDNVLVADARIVPEIRSMSFFYDVVEFSTSIKPFYFLYFMKELNYDKVIYLDPDTWILAPIDGLWNSLVEHEAVLTPHITDISCVSGYHKESHILNRGVFNLGFLGMRKSTDIIQFLNWWAVQMQTECIRSETLFVDQKWADYIPIFVKNIKIERSKAYNISDWNYHERELDIKEGAYYVQDLDCSWNPIKFFHFSGIKQQSIESYLQLQKAKISETTAITLESLITTYQKTLLKYEYNYWSTCKYCYNVFDNGNKILLLHRRLARSVFQQYGLKFEDYFGTGKGSFFQELRKGNLCSRETANRHEGRNKSYVRRILKKMIRGYVNCRGMNRYESLIGTIHNNSDRDEQWRWFW